MKVSDLAVNAARKVKSVIDESIEHDELRPARFADFIGQREAVSQLEVLTEASNARGERPDHILLEGPPGLGKTTLALMIATETNGHLYATTGQVLSPETLGRKLGTSKAGLVFMIDEAQTMSKRVEDNLLTALQDGVIDVSTPTGPQRRTVEPFTLVAATTSPGDISEPLLQRFGQVVELTYYDPDSLGIIVRHSAEALEFPMGMDAAMNIAWRSQGTPRVANKYLRRVRDFAQARMSLTDDITSDQVDAAFDFWGIDGMGLSARDREYLIALVTKFQSGPVGATNLATAIGMDEKTVGREIEPNMMRLGLVARAPRGRVATDDARKYVREVMGDSYPDV